MPLEDGFQAQRSPCYEINDPAPLLNVRSYDNLTEQSMGGVVGSLSNGTIIVSEEEAEAHHPAAENARTWVRIEQPIAG